MTITLFIKQNLEQISYIITSLIVLLPIFYYSRKPIIIYYKLLKSIKELNTRNGYSLDLIGRTIKLGKNFVRKEIDNKNEDLIFITKAYGNKKYILFSITELNEKHNINSTKYYLFKRSIKNVFHFPIGNLPLSIIFHYYMLHSKKYCIMSSDYLEFKHPFINSIIKKVLIDNDVAIIISLLISILGALPILLKSIISIIVSIII